MGRATEPVETRTGRTLERRARRLFVFARHAESEANAARVLSSDPFRPVGLTARGRAQARALGAQLANLDLDLAVGTRLLRTQQTIEIALHARGIPTLVEPGLDEVRAGDLDGAPIETYWSWKERSGSGEPFPHGESVADALRRYATALRHLLALSEAVTLVVVHELALRHIATAAATEPSMSPGADFPNAVPYLFDEHAVRRAAAGLEALANSRSRSRAGSRAPGRLARTDQGASGGVGFEPTRPP
jgi:broad specificity phosphatase PhoE